jgi:hypothetical protein
MLLSGHWISGIVLIYKYRSLVSISRKGYNQYYYLDTIQQFFIQKKILFLQDQAIESLFVPVDSFIFSDSVWETDSTDLSLSSSDSHT